MATSGKLGPEAPYSSLKEHLENVVRDSIQAVNERSWDIHSYPWIHFASNCAYDEDWRNDLTFSLPSEHVRALEEQTTESLSSGGTGQHRFVEFQKNLTRTAPQFHVNVVDVTMVAVDKDAQACVLLNAEEMGVPPGVSRSTLCTLYFQYVKAKSIWVCVRLRALHGIDCSE